MDAGVVISKRADWSFDLTINKLGDDDLILGGIEREVGKGSFILRD